MRMLPGSSDPTAAEIARLQAQCDRARVENQLQTLDHQDENRTLQLVLSILDSRSPDLQVDRITRFSDPAIVGRGAFGLVFACNDAAQGGKRVALKVLRPSRQHDRIARERFQEELKVMTGFNHPGIVRVFGTGEIEQLPFMITEFADAGSVASLIMNASEEITPRQAAWLIRQVAEAVDEAHSTPILHRDIKPGNILLRKEAPELSEGLGRWPLLTDFGLSKNLGPQTNNPLTFEGEVLGTLSYMSPEQVRGQSLKTQSDIFPLGVILHELAHGQHPFLDESDFQTRHNIVQGPPSKPQRPIHRVPAPLDAIISKCLQKKPEDRYLHASDLAQDLQRFLHGEPISVSPPTPWESVTRWIAAHPIGSTFLGTAFCFILASVLLLSREWRIERDLAHASQSLAEDRTKISKLFLESMRATNSGINDTILTGQRVMPTALLQTLERQVPLLEEALALAPDDYLLIRQLEIMYHYKSLCHVFAINRPKPDEGKEHLSKAIEARMKSLEYITLLIQRYPEEENLLISKMNSEYFMSSLMNSIPDELKWREWITKAIASSESFLEEHPNHLDVLETANKMRMDWCSVIANEDPEEALRLYKEIGDTYLRLQIEHPSRTTLFTYATQAITQRSCLLLKLQRPSEAVAAFEQIETFFATHREMLAQDWQIIDNLLTHYALLCGSFVQFRYFSETVSTVTRWEMLIQSLTLANYTIIYGHRFAGPEFVSLFPSYYRWLALSEISSESPEYLQATQDLREGIERCRKLSETDFHAFLKIIVENHHSLETLQPFLGSATDSPVTQ